MKITITQPVLPNAYIEKYLALMLLQDQSQSRTVGFYRVFLESAYDIYENVQEIRWIKDIDRAFGNDLDVIGLLVGQKRGISITLTNVFFGFEDTDYALGFGDLTDSDEGGIWYELGASTSERVVLSDPLYRILLKLKIFKNHWDGTMGGFERLFEEIFPDITYVLEEIEPLHVKFTFLGLNQNEQSLFQSDFLPRPAGCLVEVATA